MSGRVRCSLPGGLPTAQCLSEERCHRQRQQWWQRRLPQHVPPRRRRPLLLQAPALLWKAPLSVMFWERTQTLPNPSSARLCPCSLFPLFRVPQFRVPNVGAFGRAHLPTGACPSLVHQLPTPKPGPSSLFKGLPVLRRVSQQGGYIFRRGPHPASAAEG